MTLEDLTDGNAVYATGDVVPLPAGVVVLGRDGGWLVRGAQSRAGFRAYRGMPRDLFERLVASILAPWEYTSGDPGGKPPDGL